MEKIDDGSQCKEEGPDEHGGAADRKERESRCRTGSGHVAKTGYAREGTPVSAGPEQGHLTRPACVSACADAMVPGGKSLDAS